MGRTIEDAVREACLWLPEIEPLILDSHRHFALKRMLEALDGG